MWFKNFRSWVTVMSKTRFVNPNFGYAFMQNDVIAIAGYYLWLEGKFIGQIQKTNAQKKV